MTFTKAQKEALWRKIDEVASKKKNKLVDEFAKNWKPNPKFKDLYDKLKKLDKLRKEEADIEKEITGGEYSKRYDFGDASFNIYGSYGYDRTMEIYKSQAKQDYEDKLYADKIIPSETAVMDELELQLLSKSFDVRAFLEKFGVTE